MVHTIQWRVASDEALAFWAARLADADVATERTEDGALAFADFEGLRHELLAVAVDDAPLAARADDIPAEHALQGFHAVRAYSSNPERSRELLEQGLGFEQSGEAWEARGDERGGLYFYDEAPAERGIQGAGSVHHVAWNSADEDHVAWQQQVSEHGAHPTQVIDRHYFKSIYFREPSGVLFELATPSPGFTIDEPLETLGEKLSIPPRLEELRPQIEATVKPLVNPRTAARTRA
jgi:glyoxalase family protein